MYNVGVSVKEASDGGYVIVGPNYRDLPEGQWASEIVLTKTDINGNVLWTKAFSNEDYGLGYSIDNTNDGGFIITGSAFNSKTYNSDVYLIKTNSLGDTIWTKMYDFQESEFGQSVKQTSDSGYIVLGKIEYGGNNPDIFLLKTDKNGNTSGLPTIISQPHKTNFEVYPNPVTDILNIQRHENSEVLIEIFEINGKIIYRKTDTDSNISIDISKFINGPYIVKLTSDSDIVTRLIIKSKSY